jgi:phytoene dehydrogenase-like protein
MTGPDAVVIGAGPNGLVAANLLADAGCAVVVLEAQPEPGGAVRSGALTVPGFVHDRFSAFYPLAVASPVLQRLRLDELGVRWCRAPVAVAHVFPDGRTAAIATDVERTCASVARFAAPDDRAWRALADEWSQIGDLVVRSLLDPFPPVASVARLLARLRRPRRVLELVRRTLLPVRAFTRERFTGAGATMLVAGNTVHSDLSPEASLGGFFGWLLAMLAQDVGFPAPEGGARALTDALVGRLRAGGGELRCGAEVTEVVVRGGRAVAVRTRDGCEIAAPLGVVADVVAPKLYRDLVGEAQLPPRFVRDLDGFALDDGTFKVDWALRGPVPWLDADARDAGTLHVGDDLDHLTRYTSDVATGRVPSDPFLLFGQMTRVDPTRSPPGTETAWAYTHVPNAATRPDAVRWDGPTVDGLVRRIEAAVERRAPGFGALIIDRHVATPVDFEAADANLMGGAINGGTAQLHQQLVFRPTLGRGGPRTPIAGLYLGSASAHPGGAVHGACGANAARALLSSVPRAPRHGRAS